MEFQKLVFCWFVLGVGLRWGSCFFYILFQIEMFIGVVCLSYYLGGNFWFFCFIFSMLFIGISIFKKRSLAFNLMEKGLMVFRSVVSRDYQVLEWKFRQKQRFFSKSVQVISSYYRKMVWGFEGGWSVTCSLFGDDLFFLFDERFYGLVILYSILNMFW